MSSTFTRSDATNDFHPAKATREEWGRWLAPSSTVRGRRTWVRTTLPVKHSVTLLPTLSSSRVTPAASVSHSLNRRAGGFRQCTKCFLTSRSTASGILQENQHKRQSYPHLIAQQRQNMAMSGKSPHIHDEEACPCLHDQVPAGPSLQHQIKVSPSPQHQIKVCPSLHPQIKMCPSPWVWSSLKSSLSKLRADNSTITQGCTGLTSPHSQRTSCHRDTQRTLNIATLATQPVAKRCQRLASRLHTPLMMMSASRTSQQGQVKQNQAHRQQGHVQASVLMADVQLLTIQRKCEEPLPPVTFPSLARDRSQGVNNVSAAGKTVPLRLHNSRVKVNAYHKRVRDYKATRDVAVGDEVGAVVNFSGHTSSLNSSLGVAGIPQAPPPSEASFHPHSHAEDEVRSVPEPTITLTIEEAVEGETITITRQLVVPEEQPHGQHGQNNPSVTDMLSVPEEQSRGQHGQNNPSGKDMLSVPEEQSRGQHGQNNPSGKDMLSVPEEQSRGQHGQNNPSGKDMLSVPEEQPRGQHGQNNPSVTDMLSVPEEQSRGQHGQNNPSGKDMLYLPEEQPRGQNNPSVKNLLSVPQYVDVYEGRPGYVGTHRPGGNKSSSESQG